jgi:hypothetical protein
MGATMTPEQVRAAMPPEVLELCDACRERFGARLLYLETESVKLGRDVIPEVDFANVQKGEER